MMKETRFQQLLPDFAGVQPSPTSLRETPVTDSHGRNSLHIAMRGGYGPIIETMLSNGMILISIQKLVYMVRHRWQLQPYLIRVKLSTIF